MAYTMMNCILEYMCISGKPYNIWQLRNEFSNKLFLHVSIYRNIVAFGLEDNDAVIDSSTVTMSEVQDQAEAGNEVSLVEFLANEIDSEQKCAA